ncbi:hypothetical protein ACJVC5_08465 [Peredibacter sp. HCB2-198]|uniref:hypothetical protein n=1 Tax=Peredibacter sp. HCB2-198 TaxID=3383025 RepID=UPI0038B637E7
MKFIFLFTSALFSLSAFAIFDEAKCIGQIHQTSVLVEVARGNSTGTPWRESSLILQSNGSSTYQEFDKTMRYTGPSYVRYESTGYTVHVDFAPDEVPQRGRIYQGKFFARGLHGDLRCALNW